MPRDFAPGDIVACFGTDALSRIITFGTASAIAPRGLKLGPSHVALIVPFEGRLVWSESTTLCPSPCLLRGERVSGWQLHEIDDRLDDYRAAGGRVDQYRLHPFHALNTLAGVDDELSRFALAALDYWRPRTTAYDKRTAIFSGTRLLQATALFPPADLAALFCSEYVAAVLQRMQRLSPDHNPGRFNPGRLMRLLVRAAKYQRLRTFHPDHIRQHTAA